MEYSHSVASNEPRVSTSPLLHTRRNHKELKMSTAFPRSPPQYQIDLFTCMPIIDSATSLVLKDPNFNGLPQVFRADCGNSPTSVLMYDYDSSRSL